MCNWYSDIIQKDKNTHDWIGNLKQILTQRELKFKQSSEKLDKIMKGNELLRK